MNTELESVCAALDVLAVAVKNAWPNDTILCTGVGWFAPAVTKHDLADIATKLCVDIRSTDAASVPPHMVLFVANLPERLTALQTHTVPQMFNSNAGQAIPAYIATLEHIRSTLLPAIGWQQVPDPKALPSNLVRRARAAQAELDQLIPNIAELSIQIEEIQSAHKVADSLPIDLQALAEARDKLTKSATNAALEEKKINDYCMDANRNLLRIKQVSEDAAKLVAQCEEAYQITTTKGLAGAFDQRAFRLSVSMWAWVAGLVVALGIGSYIGAHRLELLSEALKVPTPNWGGVGIQMILSLLSVGAPLWFAWLATKQIGQRFRLAEDYAFKASIAKAYEGYRKEAARIDPDFEHRLFGAALTRLDEAPLRLVEAGAHGSPWHELANSEAVCRIFAAAPELRDQMVDLLRELVATTSKNLRKGDVKGESPPKKQPQEAAAEVQ